MGVVLQTGHFFSSKCLKKSRLSCSGVNNQKGSVLPQCSSLDCRSKLIYGLRMLNSGGGRPSINVFRKQPLYLLSQEQLPINAVEISFKPDHSEHLCKRVTLGRS